MQEYEERLIRCIDIVLEQLGEDVRRTLLLHFRREKGIKYYEIFKNPLKFIDALRSILGDAASTIENQIIKNIETEFNLIHNENHDILGIFTYLQKKFQEDKDEKIEIIDQKPDFTYMQYGKKPNIESDG